MLVADDKIKVVIVQPYQQTTEPPDTEQLYMAVGSVSGDEDERDTPARSWGTTAPDVEDAGGDGQRREMSFNAADKKSLGE